MTTKRSGDQPRFDVTAFGEGGLRLSVAEGERIETAATFDVDIAGSEANVVGALARLGHPCGWVSGLPTSAPGRRVAHAVRTAAVDLDGVVWRDAGRVSCYYVEYAGLPRSTTVLYDRKDSCFARLTPADIDWDYFLDTRHIHLSGLTVPLSTGADDIVAEAIARASASGVTISFDVNYRRQLWTPSAAHDRLLPLLKAVDLTFCSQRDAAELFGCSGSPEAMARELLELTGSGHIVMSLGEQGVIGCGSEWLGTAPALPVTIVDRIGAGDALAAGVLHGWLGDDIGKGLRYGVALSALAMSQRGDMVITHPNELERLINEPVGKDIER